MAWFLVIGAVFIAFLIGGLMVAEYLYRRGYGRHSTPWGGGRKRAGAASDPSTQRRHRS